MIGKSKIRLNSPWSKYIETPQAVFSTEIDLSDADALLNEWAPTEEFFQFSGRKAWYCCEPECQFRGIGDGRWVEYRSKLKQSEFLYHNHVNPNYRVPHITHFQELVVNTSQDRIERAIAIVSNFGGGPRQRHSEISFRNRFATNDLVDLYGRASWRKYRKSFFSFPRAPKNYQGQIPGDWPAAEKRGILSNYKVCVCLENMTEPNYFTEKFVEAVCAGCIPIYRAHDSLRNTVLGGAKWVDPEDYGHDPQKTIEAALALDLGEIQNINQQWLMNERVRLTSHSEVFKKIAGILRH